MLIPSAKANNRGLSEQKLFMVWSFAVFMTTMNTTMFNVALPVIQVDLAIDVSLASWIISGYSVTLAVATLTFSRLSEYISTTKLMITGLLLISAGSFIGFFSSNYLFIVLTRLLQATGAGAIISLAVIVITRYIPSSRRARTLAMISSSTVFGLGLGPVVGGVVVQVFGWSYLFLITATVIFLMPIFISLLPKEENGIGKFDSKGCTLVSLSIISFMVFFSSFQPLFLFLAIILFIWTGRYFKRTKEPFINVDLLKDMQFIRLIVIGFVSFYVFFSTLFIVPLLLHDLHQLNALQVGFLVLPGGILSVFAARMIGRLIDQWGSSLIILFSQVLFILSLFLFIFLSIISPFFVLLAYLLISSGFTAFTTSSRNEVSNILATKEVGSGMGILQMTQFLGGAFGVTLSGNLLNIQSGLAVLYQYNNVYIVLIVLVGISVGLLVSYRRKRIV